MNNQVLIDMDVLGRTIDRLEHGHEHEKAIKELRKALYSQTNRAALQSPAPEGGEPTVVAYSDNGGALYTAKLLDIMDVEADDCEPLMTIAQHRAIVAGLGEQHLRAINEMVSALDRVATLHIIPPYTTPQSSQLMMLKGIADHALESYRAAAPLPPSPKEGGL